MHRKKQSSSKVLLTAFVFVTLAIRSAVASRTPQNSSPPYTLAEYNAFETISQQTTPQARIEACDDFVSKFPNSVLIPLVDESYYGAYNQAKNYPKVIEWVDKFLAIPDDQFTALNVTRGALLGKRLTALYLRAVAFKQSFNETDRNAPQEVAQARAAAREGLKVLNELPKPPNVDESQFEEKKKPARKAFVSVLPPPLTPLTPQQTAAVNADESAGDADTQQGQLRAAMQHYMGAFQNLPDYAPAEIEKRLREKIIKVVLQLNPPPAIPQEAIQHAAYAEAAVEEGQKDANPAHLEDAVNELQKALQIAPWWAQAYFNLGAVLQKANRPGEAAQALQLYLLADPHAANAQDVQMEIYKLQYEAKKQREGNSQR